MCSQAGGIPVYPRFSQPDNSESYFIYDWSFLWRFGVMSILGQYLVDNRSMFCRYPVTFILFLGVILLSWANERGQENFPRFSFANEYKGSASAYLGE